MREQARNIALVREVAVVYEIEEILYRLFFSRNGFD
jgi:hypothetical protein